MTPLIMFLLIFASLFFSAKTQDSGLFELNVLHHNDFHARFEETGPWSGVCNPSAAPCIGGFARLFTEVTQRQAAEPESLLLDGGDVFQGTVWYNFLRWNVTYQFMNLLDHDAHVLGNHEFDNGIDGVVPYLENLKGTVVTANIDDSNEEDIQGKYQKSVIVTKKGRRIGIIGVILSTTNILASTGRLVFTDEVEAVRTEAELLTAQGVDIIIVLSHCGLDIDLEIARRGGPHIDLIVGGHSHTLLYTGTPPNGEVTGGPYPTVVEQEGGHKVPIVQASAYTRYLGEIKLFIDDAGVVQSWTGNPIYLGNDIVQDPGVSEMVDYFKTYIDEIAKQEIGYSRVILNSGWCLTGECNLGSFICDGFLDSVMDMAEEGHWHYAHLCMINQGGIRSSIDQGIITMESLLLTTPFENNVEVFELRGDHILEALEFSLANSWSADSFVGSHMLQISGLRGTYNVSRPTYARVEEARVRCTECRVPRYEPIDPDRYYRVVSQSFLGDGGDGFQMIPENRRNIQVIGIDYAILMDYIQKQDTIIQDLDGRITMYGV